MPGYLAGPLGGWDAWNANLLLVGLIVFLIVTGLYMISVAFNLPNLKQWCKGEYMQVVVTFLLAGSMVAMITVLWPMLASTMIMTYNFANPSDNTFSQGMLLDGDKYVDPFEFVQAYISQVLLGCEKTVYRTLYVLNLFFEFSQNLSVDTLGAEQLGGWYASAYTGFFKYTAAHITNLMILNYVQIRLLTFIKYTMPLVMTMGLLLRAFPLSRGAGGLLLAAGFGFFFVYPVSLAMMMLFQPLPQQSACTTFTPPVSINPSMNTVALVNRGEIIRYSGKMVEEQDKISGLLEKAKNFVVLFYLQGAFFPVVALIITFTFIRQMGAVLGADLNEIGRGLIKLI